MKFYEAQEKESENNNFKIIWCKSVARHEQKICTQVSHSLDLKWRYHADKHAPKEHEQFVIWRSTL